MSNNLDKRKSLDKKGGFLAILIAILWSANPLAVKIGLEDAPLFRLGFMRFALGVLVVIAWGVFTHQSFKIPKKSLIPLAIASFIVPIQFAFHLFGQDQTTASHGVIMIVTFPSLIPILVSPFVFLSLSSWTSTLLSYNAKMFF